MHYEGTIFIVLFVLNNFLLVRKLTSVFLFTLVISSIFFPYLPISADKNFGHFSKAKNDGTGVGEGSSEGKTHKYGIKLIPHKFNAASNLQSDCNCVIFRLDDVQDYWISSIQTTVMDQFIQKNRALSVGPILGWVGEDENVVNKVNEGASKGLFDLFVHGWDHVDYTQLNLTEQTSTLKQAKDKMKTLFGTNSTIFVPPYDVFDNDTLAALEKLGYTTVSAAEWADNYPYYVADGHSSITDNHGIYHMPESIGFVVFNDNDSSTRVPNSQILDMIDSRISSQGYAVVTLHPQDFRQKVNGVPVDVLNQTEIKDLNSLMDSILAKNYQIRTFSQVVQYKQSPLIVNVMPPNGTYSLPQSITLTASIPSTIYYTTDGTIPTISSTSGPSPISGIPINNNSTLKFFAKDSEGNVLPMGSAKYAIIHPMIIQMNDNTTSYGLSTYSGRPINAEYVGSSSMLAGKKMDTMEIQLKKVGNPTGNATFGIFRDRVVVVNDTKSSFGLSVFGKRQIQSELVTPLSALIGKKVNTIQISLKKTGAPVGNATVGIFNSSLGIIQQFGTIDVSKIPSTYSKKSFSLPSGQVYILAANDRVGIKYAGGDGSNNIAIMTDQAGTFDGINSMLSFYMTSWVANPAADLSMTLTGPSMLLQPLYKQFGTIDVSKLNGGYTKLIFGIYPAVYQLNPGDYIGVKYDGGDLANYVAIMTDQTNVNSFDGTNTYYKYYTNSWSKCYTCDLTMRLIYHS